MMTGIAPRRCSASIMRSARLTAEEFNERLDKVYAAKTMGELDGLLADLPGIDLYRLPDAALPRYRGPAAGRDSLPAARVHGGPVGRAGGRFSEGWLAAWGSWLSVSLVFIVIWVLSGARLSVVPVDRGAVGSGDARPLGCRRASWPGLSPRTAP